LNLRILKRRVEMLDAVNIEESYVITLWTNPPILYIWCGGWDLNPPIDGDVSRKPLFFCFL
jgi:hypothetical protein